MTKKRFELTDWHEVKDNGNIMKVQEVVDKLNEQDEKIELLQKYIAIFRYDLKGKMFEIEKLKELVNDE